MENILAVMFYLLFALACGHVLLDFGKVLEFHKEEKEIYRRLEKYGLLEKN